MTVTLGSIAFRDLEIPEEINFAGPQLLARHQLIGGDRVFDAMGDDPAPIEWSGWFLGGDAANRARTLEAMKKSGSVFLLTWGSFARQVVIRSFDPRYGFEFKIAYHICCEVVPTTSAAEPSLGALIAGDFGALADLALGSVPAGLVNVAQVAIAGAAAATIGGQITAAPLYALQAALGPVQAAADGLSALQDAADAGFAEGDLSALSGLSPADYAASLIGLVDGAGALSDAVTASAYMSRIAGNLALYGG